MGDVVQARLKNALWQLGRELEAEGGSLPDGVYEVRVEGGVATVTEVKPAPIIIKTAPKEARPISE